MQDTLISLVAKQLGKEEADVSMESHFIDDLGAASLDTVELVLELEEHFDIEIPDDVASTLLTVGDVFNYLEANVK